MGDVAMLIPTLYAVAEANPKDSFTFLTQPFLTRLFVKAPSNLKLKTFDKKGAEGKLGGLFSYAYQLRREGYDCVIDLHDVLRTKVLRSALSIGSKCRSISLKKPRKERKAFLEAKAGERKPVPRMLELYADTLREAGREVPKHIPTISLEQKQIAGDIFYQLKEQEGESLEEAKKKIKRIGIAPFASTKSKTYDEGEMQKLIHLLSEEEGYYLYLLGAKGKEEEQLKAWAKGNDKVLCLVGKTTIEEEMQLIAGLDCLISMDSANAHIAAMLGTRLVTIWCVTHPLGGFMSFGQELSDCLVPDEKLYPPCSIFGKVRDKTIDLEAYRRAIKAESVASHIKELLA